MLPRLCELPGLTIVFKILHGISMVIKPNDPFAYQLNGLIPAFYTIRVGTGKVGKCQLTDYGAGGKSLRKAILGTE